MKLIKTLPAKQVEADFAGDIRIDSSICYDFIVSLRALFNPSTYSRSRRWAADQLPRLDDDIIEKGKFFFAGFDTALGYGATRVVPHLRDDATPRDLIDALSTMPAGDLAVYMLDTGETSRERLDLFRRSVEGDASQIDTVLKGLSSGWAKRCARVLKDPKAAEANLVEVLEAHLTTIYSEHMPAVTKAIGESTPRARAMLELLPANKAVEQLTGGYSVAPELGLNSIVLAPSVFIHPFMSARVDEEAGEALILYGIPSDILDDDSMPMHGELVAALKAMADPSRLTVLGLLAQEPMYTVDVIRHLGLAQTTVHHHLAQLRAAGLIRQERDRHGMKYSIRTESATEVLRALERWILDHDNDQDVPNKEIS